VAAAAAAAAAGVEEVGSTLSPWRGGWLREPMSDRRLGCCTHPLLMALRPRVGPALCGGHNHHDGHEGRLGWDEGGGALPGFFWWLSTEGHAHFAPDVGNGRVASATLRRFQLPRNDCTHTIHTTGYFRVRCNSFFVDCVCVCVCCVENSGPVYLDDGSRREFLFLPSSSSNFLNDESLQWRSR
jgi:hypothetical protein